MSFSPGSTIGILGGGQLGRMTAIAAAALGYRCHVFCPETESPAAEVARMATTAPYDDPAALEQFAASIDVATYEFENIPLQAVERLQSLIPVRPGITALQISQDRIDEKEFLNRIGIATTDFVPVSSAASLVAGATQIGKAGILKTARLGYDGKGQIPIEPETDLAAAWLAIGTARAVLEARVSFSCEISVVLGRGNDGTIAAFDPVENTHENGILRTTRAPARIDRAMADKARSIAVGIAEALNLIGVLAVELFVTRDGALLVNEIAPRPHNSGHWTIDACPTNQFELLVRAVCGLPLVGTERHADAMMTNILGDEAADWLAPLSDPAARLHLYGKAESRPGRKMGHVTKLFPRRGQ